MTLDQLPIGVAASILRVSGPRALRLRLMELGLVGGTPVHKVRVAPLGDPIELAVWSGRLSVRRHEAEHIEVST